MFAYNQEIKSQNSCKYLQHYIPQDKVLCYAVVTNTKSTLLHETFTTTSKF